MSGDGPHRFTIIHALDGGPSEDGAALLVEATGFDGTTMRFAIPVDNIQHVVAFLLVWAGAMTSGRSGVDLMDQTAPCGCLPIPATTVSVGQPEGEEGYLGISVGSAELIFSVPLSAFGPLGQSLMTVGVPVSNPPS
jgi:hypothetical protein